MVATKEERIHMPGVLESVLRYCLKDASERMEKGEEVIPFSALAVKDHLFMEEHPGNEVSECFNAARKTVQNASGAAAYGFCYDGYVDMEHEGRVDCLIAEGGVPGGEYGHAIGLLYTLDDEGKPQFQEEPIYVSKALNYMATMEPLPVEEEDEEEDDEDEEEEEEDEDE